VLALFDKPSAHGVRPAPASLDAPETGAGSSLHHIALSLPYAEQDAVDALVRGATTSEYRIEHFGWVGWRGVFTQDPEGNTVELVAYDPSLLAPDPLHLSRNTHKSRKGIALARQSIAARSASPQIAALRISSR
jgi:hypothetical protein